MKQLILLAILVMPFISMAQTRPAPNNSMEANREFRAADNSQPYSYIIMEVIELDDEKNKGRFKLNFTANDKTLAQQFNSMSGRFNNVIDVLGALGSRGAEMVTKEGNFYYFKMKMNRNRK